MRGQYRAGAVDGAAVPGYLEELGHGAASTETFVAVKAEVENWRWAGVPFYLRTGKRLPTRVVGDRHPVPQRAAFDLPRRGREIVAEPPGLRLQPDEGIKLYLMSKDPGPGGLRLREGAARTSASPRPSTSRYRDAYERLLMDVVRGNPTLFMRRDEVEAAWRWIDPILRRPGQSASDAAASPTSPAAGAVRRHRPDRARRPHLARGFSRLTLEGEATMMPTCMPDRRGHRRASRSARSDARAALSRPASAPTAEREPAALAPVLRQPRPRLRRLRRRTTRQTLGGDAKRQHRHRLAYNDMLSAHQPLERFPALIKQAAREAGGVAQFAGGVPAMCDGVTQGQPGMELSLF